MKKFVMDIILKESFYQECGSPCLPIPFSMEDMNEMRLKGGISYTVVADNLLQMVSENPEKKTVYQPLIVHCCLHAGGEAAAKGDHEHSNHCFLAAAAFDPFSVIVRINLARSYQHLRQYDQAISNYQFALSNHASDDSTWIYFIECLYAIGEFEHARNFIKILKENAERTGQGVKLSFGLLATNLLSKDHAPEELKAWFYESFYF